MLRKSKKSLALMLAIMMLATLFVGVPAASAAGEVDVSRTPTYNANEPTRVNLGTISIFEDGVRQAGDVFDFGGFTYLTFRINTAGVTFDLGTPEFNPNDTLNFDIDNYIGLSTLDLANGLTMAGIEITNATDTSFTVRVNRAAAPGNPGGIDVFLPVLIEGADPGPVSVAISGAGGVPTGEYTVGNIVSGGTKATSQDATRAAVRDQSATATINRLGVIHIEETVPNTLQPNDIIRLDLPAGVEWNNLTSANVTPNGRNAAVQGGFAGGVFIGPSSSNSGNARLAIQVVDRGENPLFSLDIIPFVDVDSYPSLGDLYASISGNTNRVTSQSLLIGKIGDFGAEAEIIGDPKTIVAGALDQEIADFRIKENSVGSLIEGRSVDLELPTYVRWFSESAVTTEKGALALDPGNNAVQTTDNSRNIKRYTVDQQSTGSPGSIKFERNRVFIDADAPEGDVVLKIHGHAGIEAEFVIATVVKPVTGVGGTNNVIIGLPNQSVSDLTISEDIKTAIHGNPNVVPGFDRDGLDPLVAANGFLVLDAPNGVTFAKVPTVEVTEGDLKLNKETARLIGNDNQVQIRVQAGSTTPSTVVISDLELTLDRTVPEGALFLGVTGTSVDRTSEFNDVNVQTVQVATVTTPAPTDKKIFSQFTIDSTTYVVNDEEFQMDVAPYINADNRTMMPLRYVGYALGVEADNMMYNEDTRTATLVKGDKVVQVQVGSNILKVNNIEIPMDTMAENVDSRVMLPMRFVAQAFGATVSWDEDARVASFSI